jgi:AraC family transcriptional regulator
VTTVHLPNSRLVNLLGDGQAEACIATLRTRWGFADPFLSAAVSQLAKAFDAPSERGSLYADALADAVTMHLFRETDANREPSRAAGGLTPRALRIARDCIESGLAGGASLDEIATEVGLSRYHFSRAFKASTGLAPHRYVTLRRIDRAKELLRSTDTPLIDVALAVGFSSQSHLCDSFRRFVGVSPREYRRSR